MHNWNIRTLLDFVFGAYCNFFGRPTESRFRFEYYIKFFVLANKFRHDLLQFFCLDFFCIYAREDTSARGKTNTTYYLVVIHPFSCSFVNTSHCFWTIGNIVSKYVFTICSYWISNGAAALKTAKVGASYVYDWNLQALAEKYSLPLISVAELKEYMRTFEVSSQARRAMMHVLFFSFPHSR